MLVSSTNTLPGQFSSKKKKKKPFNKLLSAQEHKRAVDESPHLKFILELHKKMLAKVKPEWAKFWKNLDDFCKDYESRYRRGTKNKHAEEFSLKALASILDEPVSKFVHRYKSLSEHMQEMLPRVITLKTTAAKVGQDQKIMEECIKNLNKLNKRMCKFLVATLEFSEKETKSSDIVITYKQKALEEAFDRDIIAPIVVNYRNFTEALKEFSEDRITLAEQLEALGEELEKEPDIFKPSEKLKLERQVSKLKASSIKDKELFPEQQNSRLHETDESLANIISTKNRALGYCDEYIEKNKTTY